MSAIPQILAYRTPPLLRPPRLPWKVAAVAWAHVALGAAMMLLARSHNGQLKRESLLTIWTVTMIVAPVAVGGAVLLGQRRFLARLIAAIFVLPLMPAELGLGVCGLLIVVIGSVRGDGQRLTIGIAIVAIAAVLVWMTNLLLRYISKPCDPANTAILPS